MTMRLVRRTDPQTSKDAAVGDDQLPIMKLLQAFGVAGSIGFNVDEAKRYARLKDNHERVYQLSRKGWIAPVIVFDGEEIHYKTRPSDRGRAQRVYVITAVGREQL